MKYLKMLGLLTLAAIALMAPAGSASATILTSPAGTEYTGPISASLAAGTEAVLKSAFIGEIKCGESTIKGEIEHQGATETASGKLTSLTFTKCNATISVLKTGSLEGHTDSESANGNGILTSSGTEVTVEIVGLHCIFSSSNTTLGTITGGSPAAFTANSAPIPRSGGRSGAFCGTSALWTANYAASGTLLID